MFHISKQNVAMRIQAEHLLNFNGLEIVWSSFLLIIMNKLLRKPTLVRKSLFHLFWYWFLTLSFAIQIFFCKVAGENGKKLLPETFLSCQKGISFMDVFIFLLLSKSARLRRKWFLGENKERKTKLLQETQADQIS